MFDTHRLRFRRRGLQTRSHADVVGRWLAPIAFVALALFAGCSTPPPSPQTGGANAAPAARVGTDFAAVSRCMDDLLLDSGTHDLALGVDEVVDADTRSDAATPATLMAAVAGITQRSRAIRLVTATPAYLLRATIHGGSDAGASTLALDLTLLSARDMSIVPGTASHASATLGSAGGQNRVELRKFGTRFDLPAGSRAQATRALMDLGAIEVVARLVKVPYWSCFGATAADAGVAAEIQSWYDTMAARPAEIIGFFQSALRARHVYDGPIDGAVNAPLKEAVSRYREALGLAREPKLSLDFFQAYLAADHRQIETRLAAAPAVPQPPAGARASPVSTPPPALALQIASGAAARALARGEAVQLTIRPSRDAHVYCFHQDENGRITRFFPNRFREDSLVPAADGVQLPGAMRFEIAMNQRGAAETVSCFATDADVLARLPAGVNKGDFDALPVTSLEQVRSAFVKVTDGAFAQQSLQLRAR